MRQQRRPNLRIYTAIIAYATVTAVATNCQADGGRVVHIEKLDDVTITVFAVLNPLTTGPVDVSFLVQDATSLQTISDASISILCQQEAAHEHSVTSSSVAAAASRQIATNKLLQSAIVNLPASGEWHVMASVTIDKRDAEFNFMLSVADASAASQWHTAVILPIAGITLFAIHRQLERQQKKRTKCSQPTRIPAAAAPLK